MPQAGQVNTQFGVYKNLCCGAEIVITKGAIFPDCPHHLQLTTIWKPVDFEMTLTKKVIQKKEESEPAA